MKTKMCLVTAISLLGLLISGGIYCFTKNSGVFSLCITFGTILYHFAVRLLVGFILDKRYKNQMDPTKKWFKEKTFEPKLYKFLKVKKWKKHLPTYNTLYFDIKSKSLSEIIGATCQAEVVHEVNMLISLVPIVFSVWFGSFAVFLITSFAAAAFDGVFVIMQRYNRPRLMKLLK